MSETAAAAPEASERTVRTHLGWAVASAILCFLPLGLIAVIYAVLAHQSLAAGDEAAARRRARVARRWLVAAIIVGVVVDLILGASFILLGAFSR